MKEDDLTLKVNQLIELEMNYNGEKVVVSSRIEDIREDYLLIAAPIRHGVSMLLPYGSEIIVQFWVRDTLWGFDSVVIGKRINPIPMWVIKKPDKFRRVPQKRQSVRLNINLPITFQYLDRDDQSVYQGITVDISAGGVLFSSAQSCTPGEKIKIEMELTEQLKISSEARVIRCFDKHESGLKEYRIAIQFENMTENQRDKIFKFIFDKQREWIRKVLLE